MSKIIDLVIKEKQYIGKKIKCTILKEFKLEVYEGETVAIVGQSGVGKTSLLNILGLLDIDYNGSYFLFGEETKKLNLDQRSEWRNQKIGFVLQESALIHSLTIEENIKLPLLYAQIDKKENEKMFNNIVDILGIKSILKKKPLECSGGEKARAVFARAVIMRPRVILCDEPTASLDADNKRKLMNLLFDFNRDFNATIVTVTHDEEVAGWHKRIVSIERKK